MKILGHENINSYKQYNTTEEKLQSKLHEILQNRLNRGGISIWQTTSNSEIERIIAGVTYNRKDKNKNIQYIVFNGCVLVPIECDGNTVATDINHLHRDYPPPINDNEIINLMDNIAQGRYETMYANTLQKHYNEFEKC